MNVLDVAVRSGHLVLFDHLVFAPHSFILSTVFQGENCLSAVLERISLIAQPVAYERLTRVVPHGALPVPFVEEPASLVLVFVFIEHLSTPMSVRHLAVEGPALVHAFVSDFHLCLLFLLFALLLLFYL